MINHPGSKEMTTRYILAWLPMIVLAILNGALREFSYARIMSDQLAHQISTITLIVLFAIYVRLLSLKWPLQSLGQAVLVGVLWLLLTVAFEFGMGRVVSNLSWQQMLQAYNIFAGNLWLLVPVSVAVLPTVMYRVRHKA